MENVIYFEEFCRIRKEREHEKDFKEDLREIRRLIYEINNYEKPLKSS